MIINSENPIANAINTQIEAKETLTVKLSPEAVKELDIPQTQIVQGTVSEDGKSISINTSSGSAEIKGDFATSAGENVNVRVTSADTPKTTKSDLQEVTRQKELDKVFENVGSKIEQSDDVEKLLTDLKTAIEGGESSVFGELNIFEDLPPIEVLLEKPDVERATFLWEAPEARETEEAELGETWVDFADGEINSGEEEWMGFHAPISGDLKGWTVNIEADIGKHDHIWLLGKIEEDNHSRFNMFFDKPRTAAFVRQNIKDVTSTIESFGMIVDHLGISPFPRDRIQDHPKSTFLIEA